MNLILNFCPDYYEFRGHHSIRVSLPQTQPEDEGWSRFSAVNFAAQIWHLHVTCHRRINQKNLLLLLRSSRVGFLIIFNSTRRVGVEIKHAVARTISRCFEATICGPRNWFSFSFFFLFHLWLTTSFPLFHKTRATRSNQSEWSCCPFSQWNAIRQQSWVGLREVSRACHSLATYVYFSSCSDIKKHLQISKTKEKTNYFREALFDRSLQVHHRLVYDKNFV